MIKQWREMLSQYRVVTQVIKGRKFQGSKLLQLKKAVSIGLEGVRSNKKRLHLVKKWALWKRVS